RRLHRLPRARRPPRWRRDRGAPAGPRGGSRHGRRHRHQRRPVVGGLGLLFPRPRGVVAGRHAPDAGDATDPLLVRTHAGTGPRPYAWYRPAGGDEPGAGPLELLGCTRRRAVVRASPAPARRVAVPRRPVPARESARRGSCRPATTAVARGGGGLAPPVRTRPPR